MNRPSSPDPKKLFLLFPLSGLLSHTLQGWLLLITRALAEMSSSKKSFLMTYLGYLPKPDNLRYIIIFISCCSVAKSCLTLCDPKDCSTPGFPVLHYLPEFAQTLVRWVSDAIKPSHPLLPPSPPALNLSQRQGFFPMSRLFASEGQSIGTLASASVFLVNTLGWFPLRFISNSAYYNLSLSYMFTVCFNSLPLDNKFHKGRKVSVFFFTMSLEPGFQEPIFI